MKHRRLLALLLAAVLAVTALGASALAAEEEKDTSKPAVEESAEKPARGEKPGGKEKVAEPEGAVGKEAAKAQALSDAGLTADQAGKVRSRVTKTEDGTVIYKVSFTFDGRKYSYKVDALTGKILGKEQKEAEEKADAKKGGHGKKSGGKEKVAEPEGAVGKDAAKAAALADAGITADQTGKVRSRVAKTEDGTVIYKVSFRYEGQKYSYKVDALTGKILDKTVKEITEKSAGETKDAKSA